MALTEGRGQLVVASVYEQGVMAGCNFLMSVLLARQLSLDEFGAFATLQALSRLYQTFHNGAVGEPLVAMRLSSRKIALISTVFFWFIFSIVGLLLMHNLQLAMKEILLFIILGVSIPLMWLLRRILLSVSDRLRLIKLSSVYLLSTIIIVWLAIYYNISNLSSAIALISIPPAICFFIYCRSLIDFQEKVEYRGVVNLLANSKHYILLSVCIWLPANAIYIVAPYFGMVGELGAFRAIFNLFLPLANVNSAFAIVLLKFWSGSSRRVKTLLFDKFLALLVSGNLFYLLLAQFYGSEILLKLYGEGFAFQAEFIQLCCVIAFLSMVNTVLITYSKSRADETRPLKSIFIFSVISLVCTVGSILYFNEMGIYLAVITCLLTSILFQVLSLIRVELVDGRRTAGE